MGDKENWAGWSDVCDEGMRRTGLVGLGVGVMRTGLAGGGWVMRTGVLAGGRGGRSGVC